MTSKWIAVLCGPVVLVALISACGGESEQISCVNSLECPGALICEDGWCVEDTGETPDNTGTGDPDMVDEDTDPGYDSVEPPSDDDTVTDEVTDTVADDAEPLDDEDVVPTDEDTETDTDEVSDTGTDTTVDEDLVTDTVTDTGTDTVVDEDVVTDTTPDVDTVVSGQTGSTCTVPGIPGDCAAGNVCSDVFVDQIENYCYLNCAAPNETVCGGTNWPECVVVGGEAICLATASIVGNFTATVGSFVTTNNISLTINGTTNIQAACSASKNSSNDWVLQCSKILTTTPNKIQLDAVFFWPAAAHAVGTVAGAEGQVYETTYNSSNVVIDNWIRAFFLSTDGTLTLTQAGTTTGATVAGSLNFNGNAYDAQFAP